MNVTRISIDRPSLVVVALAVILILGSISYYFLSYELVPKFNPPTIAITASYPGASPSEVESNITRPIEDVLSSIANVDRVNSFSQENFGVVRLQLNASARIDQTLLDVQRRVALLGNQLPEGVQPVVSRFDFDDLPVLRIGARADLPDAEFYQFIENTIQPELARLSGVAQVRILGGNEREIKVEVDPRKLDFYGLSLLQLNKAIAGDNQDFPGGRIKEGNRQQFVRLKGRLSSLEQIEQIEIKTADGRFVSLSDVAIVADHFADPNVITRINGQEALGIEIRKQSDANAVDMSSLVREALENLEQQYSGISLTFTIAADSSRFTLRAANAVMEDLGFAVVLVSLVMLLFLHSLRNSAIVLVSIPTSIVSTLIVMYYMGYTLNLMTLLGLSLAIGILVDDSIVVLENIYRHLEMGKDRRTAAFEGRMEIGFTALSITLVDVVVFMPILFSQGIVADLFEQFSVVMIASTLISLVVSFTLVPLLASRFSRLEIPDQSHFWNRVVASFESLIEGLSVFIGDALKWALHHKALTVILALVLFMASISLIISGLIGTEFTKAGDRGEFILELDMPRDATLDRTNKVAIQVEQYLKKIPEIDAIFTTVGLTSSGRIESNPSYKAEILVQLIEKEEREISASQLARAIKVDLQSNIPDLIASPVEINLIGLREDGTVEVTIFGSDLAQLRQVSDRFRDVLDGIEGTIEVKSSVLQGGVDLELLVDHELRDELEVDIAFVGQTLRTALSGVIVGQFEDGGDGYDIRVKLADYYTRDISDVRNLSVPNKVGQLIRLGQFVDINETSSPGQLERTNRSSSVSIKSQVIGRTGGSVGREFQDKVASIELPEGVTYVFTGQLERLAEGFQTLIIALIASVLFVYLIMVALYDSYIYPFVVLFSIPMAVVGALLLLALTQESLNIFSIFGLIMLVGLVGKNAILVVDFTNNLRKEGMQLLDALIEATRLRFRPVLMTNLSMVIGLMPIALASGAGSEWKNGLALALIGGLSSSMFLSLILVPVVYVILEKLTNRAQ